MYEAAAKDAIYNLIDANRSALLSGIIHQGQARAIQLVREVLTPIQYAYYISLAVPSMSSYEDSGSNVEFGGLLRASYNMELELLEYANALMGDEHIFHIAGRDFDLLVARLIKLLREQSSFTSSLHGTHVFKLARARRDSDNRRIDVDAADLPSSRTGGKPAFYVRLRFSLEEPCVSLAGAS
jgi:hypothetical protein